VRIGIIGGGISGLACAWFLKDHQVDLFERHSEIGIAARGLTLQDSRIDIPIRVISPGYYQSLMALYKEAGIELESTEGGVEVDTFGVFKSYHLFNTLSVPFLPKETIKRLPKALLWEVPRFFAKKGTATNEQTFGNFMSNYPKCYQTILPYLSIALSATFLQVSQYPAKVVIDYITSGHLLKLSGVNSTYRVKNGISEVASKLTSHCQVLLNSDVSKVLWNGEKPVIVCGSGSKVYDKVIIATEASAIPRMMEKASLFKGFEYTSSKIAIHKGEQETLWKIQTNRSSAQVSLCLDKFQGVAGHLQTWWHGEAEGIKEDTCLTRSLKRVVLTPKSFSLLNKIEQMQGEQGVYYCGSYLSKGVSLLENGVRSAKSVCSALTSHMVTQEAS
jgi:uncharacterized protein